VLAACGGGGDENRQSNSQANASEVLNYVIKSEPFPYESAGILEPGRGAHTIQPMGTIVATLNDQGFIFVFPTYFYEEPLLEGYSFLISDNEIIPYQALGLALGSARDSEEIVMANGATAFAIADTGLETSGGHSVWPFGDVWLLAQGEIGIERTKISTVKSFYHSIAVGDINQDSLSDILALHMGSRANNDYILHPFIQDTTGEFSQQDIFSDDIKDQGNSGGAVAIADINGDGINEIILGRYVPNTSEEDVGFSVLYSENGVYTNFINYSRESSFSVFGVTTIEVLDFDYDGDMDLIFALEGHSEDPVYGRMSIELYENDGTGEFTNVTQNVLTTFFWSGWQRGGRNFREFKVFDINNDGRDDILLDPWLNVDQKFGHWIFLNDEEEGFIHQADNEKLNIDVTLADGGQNFKFVDREDFQLLIFLRDETFVGLDFSAAFDF
jgi:hypothetical protein